MLLEKCVEFHLELSVFDSAAVSKLDGVGPVYNRPYID